MVILPDISAWRLKSKKVGGGSVGHRVRVTRLGKLWPSWTYLNGLVAIQGPSAKLRHMENCFQRENECTENTDAFTKSVRMNWLFIPIHAWPPLAPTTALEKSLTSSYFLTLVLPSTWHSLADGPSTCVHSRLNISRCGCRVLTAMCRGWRST